MTRPTGVTILAILAILGGIAGLAGGGLSLTVGGVLGSGFLAAVGVYAIVIGLIDFAAAYGFWVGKRWAWWLGIIVGVLDVLAIIQGVGGVVSLIIGLIIIYYLTRPHVKAWFTRM